MKSLRRMMLAVVTGACIAANGQMLQDIKGEQTGMSGSKKGPDVSLGIGVDGGWMTSKVYTPAGDYTWKGGVGFVAKMNCVFSSGMGFGMDYEHSQTSYPVGPFTSTTSGLNLDYYMPYFLYSTSAGGNWLFCASVGLGVAHYKKEGVSQTGLGFKTALGVEYMVHKNVGIALDVERRIATFSEPDDFNYYKKNKNESYGFSRLAIGLGLLLHL